VPLRDAGAVLEEMQRSAAGRALAELAQRRPGLWVVGGAVRDALLGLRPRELDVVVEGDAAAVARELAQATGGALALHPSFGTASVAGPGTGRVDLASARRETYSQPGALPDVAAAGLEEDLARRDFSVNAIAVAAGGGELRSVPHALEDLAEGRLRVLHDASFLDDPTRLLRLARYAGRLGFDPDEHTRLLAARAVRSGAPATLSGARLGAELRLVLAEDQALRSVGELRRLGLLETLHPRLRLDARALAGALELLPPDGRRDLLILTALALPLAVTADPPRGGELRAWLDRLEFPAADRDRVVTGALAVPRLIGTLALARRPSELRDAVGGAPVEAVALAGALGVSEPARKWLLEVRHVRLQIDGHDLLAAGVPPGPEIGRRLARALRQRLDGTLPPGRDAELRVALEPDAGRAV
jgi:tRNA nucleotidyltransferase (CCA-adding enzyme)